MQVTELESKGLKKNFKIVVGADAIRTRKESELKEVGKTAKIAGFRTGNVPLKILEQRYGKAVEADVVEKVINNSVHDLVTKNKFRPAITPKIDMDEYKDGGELAFKVAFELFPDLPELAFDDITLERKVFEITDEDIADAKKRLAERSPEFVDLPASSKAEKGNIVKIDFVGTQDGVAFDGGTASDFDLELGSGRFIEGFEDQLIGAKAGDKRTVKVTFPAKYPSANLAGKDAEFAVTIKSVQEAKSPEVNEEFATKRGFANLEALTEAIKKQMQMEFDQVVRSLLKKQLFDVLEGKYNFELPETMLDMEFKTIWNQVKQAKSEGDESLQDKNEAELEEEYKNVAKRRVTLGILLAEVGSRNKIQVSRDEISAAVFQQARQFPGQERMIFEFYKKNPNRLEDLRGPILEEKAVDFILTKAKFNDVKVPLSQLIDADDEEIDGAKAKEKSSKSAKSTKSSTAKSKKKDAE